MKQILTCIFIATTAFMFSCSNQTQVTNRNDVQQFLIPAFNKIRSIDRDIVFWSNRLTEDKNHTGAQIKLAGLYAKRFQYSGNINEIKIADSLYHAANRLRKHFTAATYRSLAANAITQHKFWQSKYYLDSAAALGDNLAFTLLQQFDTWLELGNIYEAKNCLQRYPLQSSFEVLIRKAKLSDHEGKLEEAIALMEQAQAKLTKENDEAAWLWVTSNLGDFYSHANRFKEAYQSYLNVLNVERENYHCLKGIAWLAFSKDRNTTLAKEILLFLQQQHPVPDYELLLAEIAAYENNEAQRKKHIRHFVHLLSHPAYGDMYNKYLFTIYADEWMNNNKAMLIAETEVKNRPTAESYDLLSWAYYKKGNFKEALRIASYYVENKCFEPEALFHLAMIYKANGEDGKAKQLMKEVNSSLFELGPVFEKQILN